MPNTAARRRAIRRIITHQQVGSQSELVDRLRESGHDVTQATVSRDLKELGAFKARSDGGGTVYALPSSGESHGPSGPQQALQRALIEFAETIVPAANLIVIKTPPGAAQVVAGAVDGASVVGVLGTVAGDDTVLVVIDEHTGARPVAQQLERIGAGP
jgi:transcriptional regulator of arginine metabolism